MPQQKKRATGPRMKSFRGVFVFPKLNAADDKFKKEGEFSVKLRAKKDDEAVQALIAKLEPLHQKAVEAGEVAFKALKVEARKKLKELTVNPFYTEVFDEETEEPTGEIEMKFAVQASRVIKSGKFEGETAIARPTISDAKGKPIVEGYDFKLLSDIKGGTPKNTVFKPTGPAIWDGSEGIVAFEVALNKDEEVGYFIPGTGACGISLRLRAVQLLKLVQGGGNADYGFGEEDGYEADEERL
jgi:hypothetical protein